VVVVQLLSTPVHTEVPVHTETPWQEIGEVFRLIVPVQLLKLPVHVEVPLQLETPLQVYCALRQKEKTSRKQQVDLYHIF
jgi:hypothetical protein